VVAALSQVDKCPIPFGSFVLTFCAAEVMVVLVNGPQSLARCNRRVVDSSKKTREDSEAFLLVQRDHRAKRTLTTSPNWLLAQLDYVRITFR
jgi:hypothetical protein